MGLEPDIFDDWLTALRSGQYRQWVGSLRKRDRQMCVLGVLCDLHPDLQWEWDENCWASRLRQGAWFTVDKGADPNAERRTSSASLPQTFLDRRGLQRGFVNDVTSANDGGMSLNRLADLLEHDRQRWVGEAR